MSKNGYGTAEIDALVGERVRSRRLQAKVSQAALGEALGVTFQQIHKYETGANRIGCGRLLKIAQVLKCDVAEFYRSVGDRRTGAGTPFSRFLATKDGVALIEAMLKIENPALRRAVIEIAEKFAELQLGRSKVPAPRASNVTRLHDDRRPRQRGNRRAQAAGASGEPAPGIGRQE
jgi:transcriptional regulator with XRE-family HTH domain